MNWRIRLCTLTALAVGGCVGQSAFDVASIKPSALARAGGEGSGRERVTVSPSGVTFTNASLSYCIQRAYGVRFYQIAGPDWIARDRFDIEARTGHPVGIEWLRGSVRGMLGQRFKLDLHHENRVRPVFALVARKHAVKLPESTQTAGMRVVDGSFVFTHVTMGDLAEHLSDLAALDRPVVDQTGIPGIFDVVLRQGTAATRDDPGPIFTSLGELGLELRATRAPLDTIVVDHAERPDPN